MSGFQLYRNRVLDGAPHERYTPEETIYPTEADAVAAARQLSDGDPEAGAGFFVLPAERRAYEPMVFVPANGDPVLTRGSRAMVPVRRADTEAGEVVFLESTLSDLPDVRCGGMFATFLVHDLHRIEGFNPGEELDPWCWTEGGSRQCGTIRCELFRVKV